MDHFQLTFVWPDTKWVPLLVVLSPLARGKAQEGPDLTAQRRYIASLMTLLNHLISKNFTRDLKKKNPGSY